MNDYRLDFVAVGPYKTGTSWMHKYLSQHTAISLPITVKETLFFHRQSIYERGLKWYFYNFETIDKSQIIGEIAPGCFNSIAATERIYRVNPQCKIIITLREPISRLFSFYRHKLQRGNLKTETSFIEALHHQKDLKDTGLYYTHICRWMEKFGEDNVKIIFYDLLEQSPQDFADQICQALEVDSLRVKEAMNTRVNESRTPISPSLSKASYSLARFLHKIELHGLVDYGKKIGFQNMFLKKKSEDLDLTVQESAYALDLILEEINQMEQSLKLDVSRWRKNWQERGLIF